MSEITILEVDSELGAGTRGASLGIGALKVVAHNRGATVFADYPSRCANTMNEKLWDPVTTPHAKYVSSIGRGVRRSGGLHRFHIEGRSYTFCTGWRSFHSRGDHCGY